MSEAKPAANSNIRCIVIQMQNRVRANGMMLHIFCLVFVNVDGSWLEWVPRPPARCLVVNQLFAEAERSEIVKPGDSLLVFQMFNGKMLSMQCTHPGFPDSKMPNTEQIDHWMFVMRQPYPERMLKVDAILNVEKPEIYSWNVGFGPAGPNAALMSVPGAGLTTRHFMPLMYHQFDATKLAPLREMHGQDYFREFGSRLLHSTKLCAELRERLDECTKTGFPGLIHVSIGWEEFIANKLVIDFVILRSTQSPCWGNLDAERLKLLPSNKPVIALQVHTHNKQLFSGMIEFDPEMALEHSRPESQQILYWRVATKINVPRKCQVCRKPAKLACVDCQAVHYCGVQCVADHAAKHADCCPLLKDWFAKTATPSIN